MSGRTNEERKPILQDSATALSFESTGIHTRSAYFEPAAKSEQQHLIIEPIEFDHKHRNLYGYYAFGAFILVLINYLMIKERSCHLNFGNGIENYNLIQSFHLLTLIVGLLVFVLSYFNFALVISEFKLLFYASAGLIFACSGVLIYNVISITEAPCVPLSNTGLISLFDASIFANGTSTVFSSGDGIGITVFLFDILAAILMFLAGRSFYKR